MTHSRARCHHMVSSSRSCPSMGSHWRDYHATLPTLATYLPLADDPSLRSHLAGVDQFFTDAAQGRLPPLADRSRLRRGLRGKPAGHPVRRGLPRPGRQRPHGVSAVGQCAVHLELRQHGGYFDHVPPPRAVTPDEVPPDITVPPDQPGGYNRYGFRVPMGVASPYAKPHYVSHVVSDHASVLNWSRRSGTFPPSPGVMPVPRISST